MSNIFMKNFLGMIKNVLLKNYLLIVIMLIQFKKIAVTKLTSFINFKNLEILSF